MRREDTILNSGKLGCDYDGNFLVAAVSSSLSYFEKGENAVMDEIN
jgi:hypothetical protein